MEWVWSGGLLGWFKDRFNVDGVAVDDNNSILRTIDGDMLDLIIVKVDDEVRSYVEDIFSITRD